ncbi:hypothetical protein Tco_1013011 [Tanacetum coccineum]
MVRKAELKKQRVFNTGNGVAKPVWNNANRVNHANHFIPRQVQLNTGRANVNSVRPNVNTSKANVNSVRQNINTVKAKQPINTKKMSYTHAIKGNWGTAVKTSTGYNWRKTRPNSNCNNGSNFILTDHPLKNMEDRGIFDSGCSRHMTGNKDHLDDFKECKGGFVTFGGRKGYITDKGRIRVGNLDFDSVSFVKELGHFNLFSISQICDKVTHQCKRGEDISPTTLEAAKTLSKVASQRDQAPKGTKEQIPKQEEASLAEAIRLQTLEEEETAKQVHLDALLAKRLAEEEELTEQQKKRKAQVQFEAQFYTKEVWDAIRAKLEANAELTKGMSIKAQLKRYGEELQTEISKKQRIDDKDVLDTEEKVGKVKEEEPVKRVGKRKKQKVRKGISIERKLISKGF